MALKLLHQGNFNIINNFAIKDYSVGYLYVHNVVFTRVIFCKAILYQKINK
jgi:hypothetical protein